MTELDPPSLSIHRPIYAPDIDSPISRLCRTLTKWSGDYEGIEVFGVDDAHQNGLRQELARSGEIRASLGEAAVEVVTDARLHQNILASTQGGKVRPATIAGTDLYTPEGTGEHYINLRLHSHDEIAIKYERLIVCAAITTHARKKDLVPTRELGEPLRVLGIKLMYIPPQTLSHKQAQTIERAVRACKQMDVVLGSMVFPQRHKR